MSAASLMTWLGEHMPEVQKTARSMCSSMAFHAYMLSLTGIPDDSLPWDTHDDRCARYLAALRAKHPATAPRKPAPQIPPPVWDSRPINPSDAMAAVRSMCGGTR